MCGEPSTWTSPTGHHFCLEHGGIYQDLFPPEGLQPVDLRLLMTGDRPDEEWMVEPILPAGKLCGIVSKRGEGKSLLMLDIAASRAAGLPTLNQTKGDPVHVVYVDMEMGPDDLYERLADLGYLPDHPAFGPLVDHLHYYQLVALPPLDTEEGGMALEEIVERHDAQLVIIDTVSRVVTGAENDAEPYRELFRHTETRLKRRRVTLARLDHLGKDKERGSRGSSAKEDPLDVVWHLTHTVTGAIELTLTKGRQGWIPRIVTIHKEEDNGVLRHVIHQEVAEQWLLDLVERIDRLDLPVTLGVNKTFQALKEAGMGGNRKHVSQAVRFRKGRPQSGTKLLGTTQNAKTVPVTSTTRYHPQETLTNIDLSSGTTPGTTLVPVVPVDPPSKGGYHPVREAPEEDFDFADFDPADLPDPFEED